MIQKDLEKKLKWFRIKTKSAAGSNLVALTGFGNLVKNHVPREDAELRIAVVLNDASARKLSLLQPVFHRAIMIGFDPYILEKDELQSAADVFPVRFHDIKKNFLLIHGKNPFTKIQIDRSELRLRTEQEIRNLEIRFRRLIARWGCRSPEMLRVLFQMIIPFSLMIETMLDLHDHATESALPLLKLLKSGIHHFKLHPDLIILADLADFTDAEINTENIALAFSESLSTMRLVADRMEVTND